MTLHACQNTTASRQECGGKHGRYEYFSDRHGPFSEWNHSLDSDKYDKSIAAFGVWPELALLLYLWVVYFLQYRPARAGDTVYTALTRALRALPVLICRVVLRRKLACAVCDLREQRVDDEMWRVRGLYCGRIRLLLCLCWCSEPMNNWLLICVTYISFPLTPVPSSPLLLLFWTCKRRICT